MKLVVNNGFLKSKNSNYRCSIGKNGINSHKIEGDGCTPQGTFNIIKILYRPDKIGERKFFLETETILPFDGWCDDIESNYYNSQIKFPFNYSAEKLYRNDDLYDIVCIIDYNLNPVIKNRGSAIFLHVAKKDFSPTEGCIAINKNDLLKISLEMKRGTTIEIQ